MADKKLNYQIPLLVSVAGSILNAGILIFATDLDGDVCFRLMLIAQVLGGIFGGGSLCFISSCFSHISIYEESVDSQRQEVTVTAEVENSNSRSIRFSLCEASLLIGQFLGWFIFFFY